MKRWVTISIALGCVAYGLHPQTPEFRTQSPTELVETFCRFETTGGRLTPAGWNKARLLFVHPASRPQKIVILVTGNGYSVWKPMMLGPAKADVMVGVSGDIYRIDQELRIKDLSTGFFKSGMNFTVIQTDKHWELQPDETIKEVSGNPEWRIEGPDYDVWLTRDTAIQYLGKLRDSNKDPAVRQKADRAIAFLKRNLE